MKRACMLAAVALALVAPAASAAQPPAAKPLVVGVHEVAPFVIHDADGTWSGISIDLWRRIADELGLTYEIRPYEIAELIEPEKSGIDVVVSVSVNARNEEAMDVTHAFYSTGLTIATRAEPESGVRAIFSKIFSFAFLKVVLLLLAALVAMGAIVWRIERKVQPEEFGGPAWRGIFHGILWSFESLAGRAVALNRARGTRLVVLVWALASFLLASAVTAKMASELTVSQLHGAVSGPADLSHVRVGTVRVSQSARYLERRHIDYVGYDDVAGAMGALGRGDVQAVVYEAPILEYYASKNASSKLVVLPGTFENHGYGFGLRHSTSPPDLRKRIDGALLRFVESDEWPLLLSRYLGKS